MHRSVEHSADKNAFILCVKISVAAAERNQRGRHIEYWRASTSANFYYRVINQPINQLISESIMYLKSMIYGILWLLVWTEFVG